MQPSLSDPTLKLERAKEHLDVLGDRLAQFLAANPFKLSGRPDPENSLYIVQLELPVVDRKFAIIAGEAIGSLRSALDHIAWQLALTTVDRPPDETKFPIFAEDDRNAKAWFKCAPKHIPKDAVDAMESLQPYHRKKAYRDHPLWRLNKLCNIDKHRVIPAEATSVELPIPPGLNPSIARSKNRFVFSLPLDSMEGVKAAPRPKADVLFGSRRDGLAVSVRELPQFYEYVRDVVFPLFTDFFPT